MRVAFDIDRTSSKYPKIFVPLGQSLLLCGHDVILLTGINLATFYAKRCVKYPHFSAPGWFTRIVTTDLYNEAERVIAARVLAGEYDNHELVAQFKQRMCLELEVDVLFDDDAARIRKYGTTPVFEVQ